MNIQLIVHGVPNGQAFWGGEKEESAYLSTYYNQRRWTVPECLTVEMNQKSYYYTWIKGQDVYAVDGRGGSYFALTLKMDVFYADVQNIYRILSTACYKLCIGSILHLDGSGVLRFCVKDFHSQESILKEVREEVIHYISIFSKEEDLISHTAFSQQPSFLKRNLYECDKSWVVETIRQGPLEVSPYIQPESVRRDIEKCEVQIKTMSSRLQSVQQRNAVCESDKLTAQRQAQEAKNRLASLEQEYQKLQSDYRQIRDVKGGELLDAVLKMYKGRNRASILPPLGNLTDWTIAIISSLLIIVIVVVYICLFKL